MFKFIKRLFSLPSVMLNHLLGKRDILGTVISVAENCFVGKYTPTSRTEFMRWLSASEILGCKVESVDTGKVEEIFTNFEGSVSNEHFIIYLDEAIINVYFNKELIEVVFDSDKIYSLGEVKKYFTLIDRLPAELISGMTGEKPLLDSFVSINRDQLNEVLDELKTQDESNKP